jgi:shikimate dehydrogenase
VLDRGGGGVIGGATRVVGLLGKPVSESLSPRMQNAAFAARGLDWAYVALEVEPERLEEAVRGLVALGFAGANVTIPHKTGVLGLCDEVDDAARRAASVNTLVVRGGRVLGSTTDARALDGIAARRPAVIGAGGAAKAFVAALEHAGSGVRVFARSACWPPETTDCDLVVHATPVRDELLFEPRAGQAVIDLAYRGDGRPTALVEAARAAGCPVVDGLEVLVRQGAASFERWTGVEAPLEVMRAAVRP